MQMLLSFRDSSDAEALYPSGLQKVLQLLQDGSLHLVDDLITLLQPVLLEAHVAHGGDLI